jgi:hypothetical protein
MPGFVDVSHMSDLEIKRLGQMDEEDPRDSNYSHRNLARRNPYGYSRSKPVASERYPVALVWAAAVLATDTNGGYTKEAVSVYDETTQGMTVIKRRNRDIMMDHLRHPQDLTPELIQRGQEAMNFLRNDLTFRALKGKLTDFDQATSKVLAVTDQFDSALHRYEMAIVASLPASATRSQKRASADERVQFARGGLIGQPGDKVSARVEVLSSGYSQNYNCYFIKGITDQDQPVFFSYREGRDAGTWLTIQGTVKAHRDNLTQLNRVKVL